MRMKFSNLILLVVIALILMGAASPEVYFQMTDPVGDEHGYGPYQYPSNIAFKPYEGLFDITEFKVWTDRKGQIYFDTTFGRITNPWMAPEGFIHQNLRIFIDSVPEEGAQLLHHRGANVSFNPNYAWDLCLKIVGWGNSRLLVFNNGTLKSYPLNTELMGDNRTIRAVIETAAIGTPDKSWHYYVLVGSYDGFGEDFFRKVMNKPGDWVIGGGLDQNIEPQVMDIVAPENGAHRQNNQLKSFDPAAGKFAELYPVGKELKSFDIFNWLGKCAALLFAGGIIFLIIKKPRSISWFWVKQRKESKPDRQGEF